MPRKWDRKVPFNKGTNQMMQYAYSWDYHMEMRDAPPFFASLKFSHFERGRSAAHAVFVHKNDCARHKLCYYMFLKDLSDSIEHMDKGVLTGTFKFVKRGANFGIAFDAADLHSTQETPVA